MASRRIVNALSTSPVWYKIDAKGQTVGRLASSIAKLLVGETKPHSSRQFNTGDKIVVINAKHIEFTGQKWKQKTYYWHTGWPGGIKQRQASWYRDFEPEKILKSAVNGMLPKTNLRKKWMRGLRIFSEQDHPEFSRYYRPMHNFPLTNPHQKPMKPKLRKSEKNFQQWKALNQEKYDYIEKTIEYQQSQLEHGVDEDTGVPLGKVAPEPPMP